MREGVPSKKAQCLGSHVLQERGWAGHLSLGCFLEWPQADAARGINVDKDLALFGAGPSAEPSARPWPGVESRI